MEATASPVNEFGPLHGPIRPRRPRNHRFSFSPAIAGRGACVGLLAGFDRIHFLCRLRAFDFLSHGFSSFPPLFSRSTKNEWGLFARPRPAFCGGAKKLCFWFCFLGGAANPEAVAAATKQKPAVPPARRAFPISRYP